MAKHPAVLILFLGGSTLDNRPRRGLSVVNQSAVTGWLNQLGEMNVIASTDGVFVHDGLSAVGLNDWAAAAEKIKDQYKKYDGFMVIHQTATIGLAAVALSMMLRNLGKPVVLAGSPLLSPAEASAGWTPLAGTAISRLGAKANFINALQVAVSDLGEVIVVSGHHLYRGRDFRGTLAAPTSPLIGKIDFGVRFFGQWQKRRPGRLRIKNNFATKVAMIEYLPGIDIKYLAQQTQGSQGVYLTVALGIAVTSPALEIISKAVKSQPILINGQVSGRLPANCLTVNGDKQINLIRFMWALGQSRQPAVISKLIAE